MQRRYVADDGIERLASDDRIAIAGDPPAIGEIDIEFLVASRDKGEVPGEARGVPGAGGQRHRVLVLVALGELDLVFFPVERRRAFDFVVARLDEGARLETLGGNAALCLASDIELIKHRR